MSSWHFQFFSQNMSSHGKILSCLETGKTHDRKGTQLYKMYLNEFCLIHGSIEKWLLNWWIVSLRVLKIRMFLNVINFDFFLIVFIRPPPKRTMTKTITTAKKGRQNDLWRYSKEPIKQALLKKIAGKDDLNQEACECFLYILLPRHKLQ